MQAVLKLQLTLRAMQPWYARKGSTLPEAEPPPSAAQPQMQVRFLPAASISPDRSRSIGKQKHKSKHKEKSKHRERHHHSKKEGAKEAGGRDVLGVKGGVKKSREQLDKVGALWQKESKYGVMLLIQKCTEPLHPHILAAYPILKAP